MVEAGIVSSSWCSFVEGTLHQNAVPAASLSSLKKQSLLLLRVLVVKSRAPLRPDRFYFVVCFVLYVVPVGCSG